MSTWTITSKIDFSEAMKHNLGEWLFRVKVSLASGDDASASDYDLPANIISEIRGSWLYLIKTVPGTGGAAPSAAFDLDIEDDNDDHILDTNARSETATSWTIGSDTLGVYPPILGTCSVVCADLGDANTTDIYMYFLK